MSTHQATGENTDTDEHVVTAEAVSRVQPDVPDAVAVSGLEHAVQAQTRARRRAGDAVRRHTAGDAVGLAVCGLE